MNKMPRMLNKIPSHETVSPSASRAHIAAVHVPALLIQEGRMEAARVLRQERVQQQSGNIKLVSRLGTDLTGVKDAGTQAHWGPSCKQPSDHNFLESNTKERTPKSQNLEPEQCTKSQNHVVNTNATGNMCSRLFGTGLRTQL